jgi:hypothetical protein
LVTTVGVVSARLSNTFNVPFFSATKTRPSGENRTEVGLLSPEKTTLSEKPLGSEAAAVGAVVAIRSWRNRWGAGRPPSTAADDAPEVTKTKETLSSRSAKAARCAARPKYGIFSLP